MSIFKSPLRYPGGKACLYPFISNILYCNKLFDGIYAEPFAGGAGAALELLLHVEVQTIMINDIDRHIYAFWKSLLNDTDFFIKFIDNVTISLDEWQKQRYIYNNINDFSDLDIGLATFFLNRCNRSGILRGRPIGGLNQNGKWKIDARFNKQALIERIKLIALYRDRIRIFNKDAINFLNEDVMPLENHKLFIYLDPPYYVQGGQLYLNNYKHQDHIKLSEYIKALPYKWMLSYDNEEEIISMYKYIKSISINFNYRAHQHKIGKEIIFFSPDLILPESILNQIINPQ